MLLVVSDLAFDNIYRGCAENFFHLGKNMKQKSVSLSDMNLHLKILIVNLFDYKEKH